MNQHHELPSLSKKATVPQTLLQSQPVLGNTKIKSEFANATPIGG
ncbi:hypothetical protein [Nostoc sp.]